jgi:hypothetical protein
LFQLAFEQTIRLISILSAAENATFWRQFSQQSSYCIPFAARCANVASGIDYPFTLTVPGYRDIQRLVIDAPF